MGRRRSSGGGPWGILITTWFLIWAYFLDVSTAFYATVSAILIVACAAIIKPLVEKFQERRRERTLGLAEVDTMKGRDFEYYVARLLTSRGFRSVEVTKASNDFGVDITARQGGKLYAVQCKRQDGSVSRRAVSDAVGGKAAYHCNASMVITNSHFTQSARVLATKNDCKLVDRDQLADWIRAFQSG